MISAVLDTNVLASGIVGFGLPTSTPGQILRLWQSDGFELVVSHHILDELENTLQAPYFARRLSERTIALAIALLRRQASLVRITVEVQGVATHHEDDLIVATALSAQTDYLVTGDTKLQRLIEYQGVEILSPRGFLDFFGRQVPEGAS